jgi:hypothetical protein
VLAASRNSNEFEKSEMGSGFLGAPPLTGEPAGLPCTRARLALGELEC